MEEAASEGAQLVAFPELAFDRFFPQYPDFPSLSDLAEWVPGPITAASCQKARELNVVVVLNLLEKQGDKNYDCSPVIDADGKIVGKSRMNHVQEGPCYHEKHYYSLGNLGIGCLTQR